MRTRVTFTAAVAAGLPAITLLSTPPADAAPDAGFVDPNTPAGVRPSGGSSHGTLVFSDEFMGTATAPTTRHPPRTSTPPGCTAVVTRTPSSGSQRR